MARTTAVGKHFVHSTDASALDVTGALTITAWVKFSATPAYDVVVGKYGAAGQRSYMLYIPSFSDVSILTSDDGTTFKESPTGGSTWGAVDEWHHLAGVYIPSTSMTSYVDGVLHMQLATGVKAAIFNSTTKVGIGNNDTGGFIKALAGDVAEVAIYNRALTVAELLSQAKGFSSLLSGMPVSHAALLGNASPEPDTVLTTTWDLVSTPAKAAHPRIIMPRRRQSIFIPAAAAGGATTTIDGGSTALESVVAAGSIDVVITLTGDTWLAAGTGPIGTTANTQALIDGIDGDVVGGTGWDAEVKANLVPATHVVRTSATVATITLPASSYDITGSSETVTITIPAESVTGGVEIDGGTFTVTVVSASVLVAGSLSLMGVGI